MSKKNNSIYFYCSWILPYILTKGVLLENELDFYLVQETEKAIEFLKKLENKISINDEFISDFTQFCIYVSNMRHTIQDSINTINDYNKEIIEYSIIFTEKDLILLDRLLHVLYDNFRCLIEFQTLDRSKNFLLDSYFFEHNSLRSGSADIINNDYEISVKFVKE